MKKNLSNGTNIDLWEQALRIPTSAYQKLFNAEEKYLSKNIKSSDRVLDIGCGEGRNIRSILKSTKFVTGIDNDEKAVNKAKENLKEFRTINIIRSEAAKLPFNDGSFDIVTFLMILPNLDKDKVLALKESNRVLKEGGFLILSTYSEVSFDERMKIYKKINAQIEKIEGTKVFFGKKPDIIVSEQFSKEELKELANKSGFKIVGCEKIEKIAYICKFKK